MEQGTPSNANHEPETKEADDPGLQANASATTSTEEKASDSVDHIKENPEEEENEDGEEIVTLLDVLKEEEDLDEDVMAVLGDSDDKKCTFEEGYMPRQPLYACNTCDMKIDPKTGEKYLAGFCLACSYHCHEGHFIFELYTKRNFRCDCGNEKFSSTICKLTEKIGFNEENVYSQNFAGLYCTCHRPYPDPEDTVFDTMIQCAICEDWFHKRHLNLKDESNEFTELVCFLCVKKYDFLVYYNEEGLLFDEDDAIIENEAESSDSGIVETEPTASSSQTDNSSDCKLTQLKQTYLAKYKSDVINQENCHTLKMSPNWRAVLCKCNSCVEMYANLSIEFITSKSDMVYSYEQKTKKSAIASDKDSDLKELKKLPHVQQIEVIHAYNDFKNEFQEFLEPFSRENKIVRKEDVDEFVEKLKSRKRQRVGVPYHCK